VPDSIAAQLPAWEQTIAALAPLYTDARNFLYFDSHVAAKRVTSYTNY